MVVPSSVMASSCHEPFGSPGVCAGRRAGETRLALWGVSSLNFSRAREARLSFCADGKAKALERIAALKLEALPKTRFKYSDVGFIVLGEVIEKISGETVDVFARKHIFEPLRMSDTTFTPGEALKKRIAPTSQREGSIILGEVHDPRAFKLGGVAGHAGLFSTADDIALIKMANLPGKRPASRG